MNERAVVTRIRGSIEIARPVEEVFDTVADLRNEPRYNTKMTGVVKLTDGPIGAGTRFEATVESRGRPLPVTVEYTAFDRPRLLGSRSAMAGSVAEGTVRCDPTRSGTRFTWDWEVTVPWPARLAGFLVARVGQRQEQQIWSGLKRYLEKTTS